MGSGVEIGERTSFSGCRNHTVLLGEYLIIRHKRRELCTSDKNRVKYTGIFLDSVCVSIISISVSVVQGLREERRVTWIYFSQKTE